MTKRRGPTGGASSTYGADAVAGVVNFIMDTTFMGLKAEIQSSFDQHDNRNDVTIPCWTRGRPRVSPGLIIPPAV